MPGIRNVGNVPPSRAIEIGSPVAPAGPANPTPAPIYPPGRPLETAGFGRPGDTAELIEAVRQEEIQANETDHAYRREPSELAQRAADTRTMTPAETAVYYTLAASELRIEALNAQYRAEQRARQYPSSPTVAIPGSEQTIGEAAATYRESIRQQASEAYRAVRTESPSPDRLRSRIQYTAGNTATAPSTAPNGPGPVFASVNGETRIRYIDTEGNVVPSSGGVPTSVSKERPLVTLLASRHPVTYSEEGLRIGCQVHRIYFWQQHGEAIGRKEGYSEEEIDEYMSLIGLVAEYVKVRS